MRELNDKEELEYSLLKGFYAAWMGLHHEASTRAQKQGFAQQMVQASHVIEANREMAGRNPLSLAIHNAH